MSSAKWLILPKSVSSIAPSLLAPALFHNARSLSTAKLALSTPASVDHSGGDSLPSEATILDRMSLVDPAIATVDELRAAIKYADKLADVDVDGVEPMYSVLENDHISCPMRADVVDRDCDVDALKRNAPEMLEDFLVAPSPAFALEQMAVQATEKTVGDAVDANEEVSRS